MKPITADSLLGKALLALRPGGMTSAEAAERWPSRGADFFTELKKSGLVAYDGETWTLTAAGRAACPYRNPILSEKPDLQPEVFTMPRGTLTQSTVLSTIVAAGVAGITKEALAESLDATPKSIRNHLDRLKSEIAHIGKGVYAARRFTEGAAALSEPATPKVAVATPDVAHDAVDIEGVSLDVDHHDVEALPAGFDEIAFHRAATTDFAVWSNGAMTIDDGQATVQLSAQVASKMRRFLGLFDGEAA